MPRHVWTVLCDKAIVDSQSNNVSLINIIEQLNLPESACQPLLEGEEEIAHVQHQHVLCGLWEKESEDDVDKFNVRVEFKSPTDVTLGGADLGVEFQGRRRARIQFRSGGLPVVGEGFYHFIVEYRTSESEPWAESARIPVEVRITSDTEE